MFSAFKSINQSRYPQVKPNGVRTITFEELVNYVRTREILKEDQDYYRSLEEGTIKDEFKKRSFPAITIAGEFKVRSHNLCDMVKFSQFVFGDVDNILPENMTLVREMLENDPHIIFVKESVSGKGFHFVFRIDKDITFYKTSLNEKYYELRSVVGNFGKLDHNVKDHSRLMLISFDPKCYYNPLKSTYEVKGDPILESQDELDIDLANVDVSSLQSLFNSLLASIQKGSIGKDWIDGNRNNFLINVCKLKYFGVSLPDTIQLVLNYIDNRYTPEYTQKEIIKRLTNNYNSYFKLPETNKCKSKTIIFQNYLSEHISLIEERLKKERMIVIDAPTGSGKTSLVKELAQKMNLKTDILMPTTALVDQQEGISKLTGKRSMRQEELHAPILACCYNSIGKILERNSDLLIIDESHSLVSDFAWKSKIIKDVTKLMEIYPYVILLSGTTQPLFDWNKDKTIKFEKNKKSVINYSIVEIKEGSDADYFFTLIKPDYLNVFYKNDKSVLDVVYEVLTERGEKVNFIHSERKGAEEYMKIINESLLPDSNYLLTTCLIQAGVNIYNSDKPVNIIFGRGCNIIDIIQFTARFRKIIPEVILMHSGNYNMLQICNKDIIEKYANDQLRLVEAGQKKLKNYKEMDKKYILSKLDKNVSPINENMEGNFIVDDFYVLYEQFQTHKSNFIGNINFLKQVMNEAGWKCTHSKIHTNHISTNDVYQKVKGLNKERKELFIDKIVNDADLDYDKLSKTEKEIYSRYYFLSDWLTKDEIRNKKELLINNSKFKLIQDQINFLKGEYVIKSGKITAYENSERFTDVMKYINLKRKLNLNQEYTHAQIKKMFQSVNLDNYHLKDVLQKMFELETVKTRRNGEDVRIVVLKAHITFESIINDLSLVREWIGEEEKDLFFV